MIFTVTLTPALDKTAEISGFSVGKVNRIQALRQDAGGKGINVSRVLKALGEESVACGILGGANGSFIRDQLEAEGIRSDFVWVQSNTRTNLKIIDPENRTNTDVNEAGSPVSEDTLRQVLMRVEALASAGDTVVLAGKAPQGAPDTLFGTWTQELQAKGMDVFLDADAALLAEGIKARPVLIKPNAEELSRVLGCTLRSPKELAHAALALTKNGVRTVVVSMGEAGAFFVREGSVLRGQGLKVAVRSTVGAGDSMMAAMCFGVARGLPFEATCRLAMAVSAAAVTTHGTQPPPLDTVQALESQVVLETMQL